MRGGPTADGGFHHRSSVKRAPKPFKGPSKGKQERANRGKVEAAKKGDGAAPTASIKSFEPASKQARVNRNKQLQKLHREEILAQRRIGAKNGPPRIVALIPLGANVDMTAAMNDITSPCNDTTSNSTNPLLRTISWSHGARDRRIICYSTPRNQTAILDIGKVADVIVFIVAPSTEVTIAGTRAAAADAANMRDDMSVMSVSTSTSQLLDADRMLDVDDFGRHAVTILKSQGISSVIGVTQGADRLSVRRQPDFKRTAMRYFDTAFESDVKVVPIDRPEDSALFLRWVSECKIKSIGWRDARSYMLGESFQYDEASQTLSMTGYLRGNRHLAATHLLHLTGYGDFQIERIERAVVAACSSADSHRRASSSKAGAQADAEPIVLSESTPEQREPLVSLNEIDTLAHEQSIITNDELGDTDTLDYDAEEVYDVEVDGDDVAMDASHYARGVSAREPKAIDPIEQRLQAASKAAASTSASSSSSAFAGKVGHTPHQQAWDALLGFDAEEEIDDVPFDGLVDDDTMSTATGMVSSSSPSAALAEKKKLERDELEYPDEVEFPRDTICRERLARYRGLKSFRQSPWDNRENLPLEYSRIFQFANFRATMHHVKRQEMVESPSGDGTLVPVGVEPQLSAPIVVRLPNVSAAIARVICSTQAPVIAFGLLTHEHKVSVLNFMVKRQNEYAEPVKGKEPMEFHVGFRRFVARPIYSECTNASKNLVERYFQPDRFTMATVFGRIQFPPSSVLMFRPAPGSVVGDGGDSLSSAAAAAAALATQQPAALLDGAATFRMVPTVDQPIVAAGSLFSIDPDRMLIKRIVLTGHPISVHKRMGVIRHMFFNPDDVRWFKPVEVWTKYGHVGHIVEPHGTKGAMKCLFDRHLRQNDTVCMSLYKRQYPPFDERAFV